MEILVLGGTAFLSREVAAEALRRGHDVTCPCRGVSGGVPQGARMVRWDRGAAATPGAGSLSAPDVVVDVARQPSWVRGALATRVATAGSAVGSASGTLADAHWVFVSTISVYADTAVPHGRPGTTPLVEATLADGGAEEYGATKRGCEELVLAGAASSAILRPGLIVGPGDPSGRFTYWPLRLAGDGLAGDGLVDDSSAGDGPAGDSPVLAPGAPEDLVQVIDVRDLAAWIVTCAEQRTTGVLDAVGPTTALGDLLVEVRRGVAGHPADLVWVPDAFLAEQGVEPWAGERAVPLWLPRPAYDGMLARDDAPARAAGLRTRAVAETARDTLAWARGEADAVRTGLTREHERQVLAAWATRTG